MLKVFEVLLYGNRKRLSKEAEGICDTFEKEPDRVEVLYRDLSVIDGKSASLLTFNAIGLAALAVWLTGIPANMFHFWLDVVFVLLLLSCAFLLPTVRVYWSPIADYRHSNEHVRALVRVRAFRTRMYRVAWVLAVISVALLTLVSVLHAGHTLQHALGKCGENCTHAEGAFGHTLE